MKKLYHLKNKLGNNYVTNPDDVWAVKKSLTRNGYYVEPSYGLTPYPDQQLFSSIENYQRNNNLKVDGNTSENMASGFFPASISSNSFPS